MPIDGIILAAGLSKRFGRPKQLITWRGQPLILQVVETVLASQLRSVIVVIGHAAAEVRHALGPVAGNPKLHVVLNPDYEEGQASSIRRGLGALREDAQAAMFFVCDQPLLTPSFVDDLIDSFARQRALICYPVHDLMRGSPTIFAAELFPELMKLTGDVGGRVLIEKYRARVHEHKIASAKPLADIDTEADFADLQAGEDKER
jgi:molybdenum cofactor cytidylyltransferase